MNDHDFIRTLGKALNDAQGVIESLQFELEQSYEDSATHEEIQERFRETVLNRIPVMFVERHIADVEQGFTPGEVQRVIGSLVEDWQHKRRVLQQIGQGDVEQNAADLANEQLDQE